MTLPCPMGSSSSFPCLSPQEMHTWPNMKIAITGRNNCETEPSWVSASVAGGGYLAHMSWGPWERRNMQFLFYWQRSSQFCICPANWIPKLALLDGVLWGGCVTSLPKLDKAHWVLTGKLLVPPEEGLLPITGNHFFPIISAK